MPIAGLLGNDTTCAFIDIFHAMETRLARNDTDVSRRAVGQAAKLYEKSPRALQKRVVAACVGPSAAKAFFSFQRIYQRVNAKRLITDGQAIDFTDNKNSEPSFMHAAVFSVAAWLRREAFIADDHLSNIVKFLASPGLDPEYWFCFYDNSKVILTFFIDSMRTCIPQNGHRYRRCSR